MSEENNVERLTGVIADGPLPDGNRAGRQFTRLPDGTVKVVFVRIIDNPDTPGLPPAESFWPDWMDAALAGAHVAGKTPPADVHHRPLNMPTDRTGAIERALDATEDCITAGNPEYFERHVAGKTPDKK